MSAYPPTCAPGSHEWGYVQFVYAEWTECGKCGYRPEDEDDFNRESGVTQ